jgi:hypothetical protein
VHHAGAGLRRPPGRELAQLLGVQKASLYHHIRGKEDLLFEIPGVISAEQQAGRMRDVPCGWSSRWFIRAG